MPTCPNCHGTYTAGEILCPNCGADLDGPVAEAQPPKMQFLQVVVVQQDLVHDGPTITLHVIEIDNLSFPEGEIVAVVPIARLEVPVRIGRKDLEQSPPIHPELDLGTVLADRQPGLTPIVSRLHAALQLDGEDRPVMKALIDRDGTTWIRHSKDDRMSPVPPNTVRPLEHRDVVVLGYPKWRHVSLRVVFSHP